MYAVAKFQRALGMWPLALALLFGGVYFAEVQQEHARASCQTQLNQRFIDVLVIRSASSNTRQDTEDRLLDGLSDAVLNPPAGKNKAMLDERYQILFREYAAAAAAYRATKESSPLPAFPSC